MSLPRRIGDAGAGREENGGVERWETADPSPSPSPSPSPGNWRGRRRGEGERRVAARAGRRGVQPPTQVPRRVGSPLRLVRLIGRVCDWALDPRGDTGLGSGFFSPLVAAGRGRVGFRNRFVFNSRSRRSDWLLASPSPSLRPPELLST
jgi:hypothetical protein